jgi:hypothetical protein
MDKAEQQEMYTEAQKENFGKILKTVSDYYKSNGYERCLNILARWGNQPAELGLALMDKGQEAFKDRIFNQNMLEVNALNSTEGRFLAAKGKTESEILTSLRIETFLSDDNITIPDPPWINWLRFFQKEITRKTAELLIEKRKAVFTHIGNQLPEDEDPTVLEYNTLTTADDIVKYIFKNKDIPFDSTVFLSGYFTLPDLKEDEEDGALESERFFVEFYYNADNFSSVIADASVYMGISLLNDVLEPAVTFAENLDSEVLFYE